jgi:hypothetical protein
MELLKTICEGATIIVASAVIGYNVTGFITSIYFKIKNR